jgi:Cu(I)/Ag(I) efflux system membrane protein CusA/SilA
VVFEDGTDLYWARSRVSEYLQQIQGRLPAAVHPTIGPDPTGAGWVSEYLVVDQLDNLPYLFPMITCRGTRSFKHSEIQSVR